MSFIYVTHWKRNNKKGIKGIGFGLGVKAGKAMQDRATGGGSDEKKDDDKKDEDKKDAEKTNKKQQKEENKDENKGTYYADSHGSGENTEDKTGTG